MKKIMYETLVYLKYLCPIALPCKMTIQMMMMVMCFDAAFCLDCDAVEVNGFLHFYGRKFRH